MKKDRRIYPNPKRPAETFELKRHFAAGFDYESLDDAKRVQVQDHERAISALKAGLVRDAIEIGRRLCEARELLGRKLFGVWLAACWKSSQSTCSNYMAAFRRFGAVPTATLQNIDLSALTDLARDRIPDAARSEALKLAEGGAKVSREVAYRVLEKHLDDAGPQRQQNRALPTPTSPAIAVARPRELAALRSALCAMLKRAPSAADRRDLAELALESFRCTLAEFGFEHLLENTPPSAPPQRPLSPAAAAIAGKAERAALEAGLPVMA